MSVPLIYAHFNDGYTFRNSIAIIKQICPQANLTFTKTNISIVKTNKTDDILVMMDIKTSELIQYEMNTYDDHDKPIDEFNIGVDMGELLRIAKNIGKKDGMIMYCNAGDNNLYIKVISNNTRGGSGSSFMMATFFLERESFSMLQYSRDESNPNAKPAASEFAKMCTGMATIKCSYVVARGYAKGISFTAMLPGKVPGQHTQWGICSSTEPLTDGIKLTNKVDENELLSGFIFTRPDKDEGSKSQLLFNREGEHTENTSSRLKIEKNSETDKIQIRLPIIKALSKLNNLSTSPVKLYMDKKMPLKILSKIGSYGELIIFAKNAVC